MSWEPKQNVIDLAPVIDNLFAFIAANQEDALTWANGGAIAPFAKLYTSAVGRVNTVFPSLSLLAKDHASDPSNDVLLGVLSLTFEGVVSGGQPDTVVRNAMIYAKALESMLENITAKQLILNMYNTPADAVIISPLATEYSIIAALNSAYYQVFRTRVSYKLGAPAR